MKRLAILLFVAIAFATPALAPALADEPTTSPVVILRGSSAPPTPWYEPPPEPKVVVQPVYVPPLYYLPGSFYNPFLFRQTFPHSAKRNR
jgi:hypothetical protein